MGDLQLDVFVGADNAFNVTSAIVSGQRDAVVIDAQFTRTDARRLADAIKASGNHLTAVYITHGHPDHYWGLTTLREEFPQARFLTAPEVLGVIDETLAPKVAQWKPLYGDEVPDQPVRPDPLDGAVIDLEGNQLQVIHLGQGDVHDSTVVWIPTLRAVVAGDVAYNGTHVWLSEASAEQRKEWIANLDKLAAMDPVTVVAGHKVPAADDDARRVLLEETRDYVAAFDAAVRQSSSTDELIERVNTQYGDRQLPMILDIAAGAAFPG